MLGNKLAQPRGVTVLGTEVGSEKFPPIMDAPGSYVLTT